MNITHLEELCVNAWPALHTLVSDGWVLRLANGYTRRANSVSPLYAGLRPVEEKIRAAEAFYGARGQPTVFKLTAAAQPPELDAGLEARGYALEAPTSGQVLDLRTARLDGPGTARIFETPSDEWMAAYCALSQVAERHVPTMRRMLESLVPVHGFFVNWEAGAPGGRGAGALVDHVPSALACGLAVMENGYVGLADIVTGPAHRRQGHAQRLLADMLGWAAARGAHTAYLQVMLDNAPALRLYAGLGFEEVYRYWYRVQGSG